MTAFTTPTTRTAGQTISATIWNGLANNDTHFSEILSWNPTVTQSSTVTKTVSEGWYGMAGKRVWAECMLTMSASGTSGQPITLSLPVTAASSAGGSLCIGSFQVNDTGTQIYCGVAVLQSTTTLGMRETQRANVLGAAPAFGLASGDTISVQICYRAA